MSERVEITPDGWVGYTWNPTIQQDTAGVAPDDYALLRRPCTIAEGTTLRDLARGLEERPLLRAFIARYSLVGDMDTLQGELLGPDIPLGEQDGPPLRCLELSRYVEVMRGMKRFGADTDVQIEPLCFSFSGLGPDDQGDREEIAWSLGYQHPGKYAAVPLVLNTDCAIYDFSGDPAARTEIRGATRYTLLEVVGEIYWDITFWGVGAHRERNAEDLNEPDDATRGVEITSDADLEAFFDNIPDPDQGELDTSQEK